MLCRSQLFGGETEEKIGFKRQEGRRMDWRCAVAHAGSLYSKATGELRTQTDLPSTRVAGKSP